MLGHVDRKTKLFVPRGAKIKKSKNSKNFKKSGKFENINREPLRELVSSEIQKNDDFQNLKNFENGQKTFQNSKTHRSKSKHDIPYKRSFVQPAHKFSPSSKNLENLKISKTQNYVAKSKERIKSYKNRAYSPTLERNTLPKENGELERPEGEDFYQRI